MLVQVVVQVGEGGPQFEFLPVLTQFMAALCERESCARYGVQTFQRFGHFLIFLSLPTVSFEPLFHTIHVSLRLAMLPKEASD